MASWITDDIENMQAEVKADMIARHYCEQLQIYADLVKNIGGDALEDLIARNARVCRREAVAVAMGYGVSLTLLDEAIEKRMPRIS